MSIAIVLRSTFWCRRANAGSTFERIARPPSSRRRIFLIVDLDWLNCSAMPVALTHGNSSMKAVKAFLETSEGRPAPNLSWHERLPFAKRARYSLTWLSEYAGEASTAINSLWTAFAPRPLRKKNLMTNLRSDFSIWRNDGELASCWSRLSFSVSVW
jgi:hypothetical protein